MIIDAIFFLTVLGGFWSGFSRGIIKTVMYLFASFFGFIVAVKFAPAATDLLRTVFNSSSALMPLLGFITCLGLTIVAIQLLAKGLEGILQTARINIINKFFGGVLMAGIFVLFYSVLLWFADKSHLLTQTTKDESATYKLLEQYPGQAKELWARVQPTFEDFWNQSLDFIDQMEDSSIKRNDGEAEIYDIEEEGEPTEEF